jgi:hypothetical protein
VLKGDPHFMSESPAKHYSASIFVTPDVEGAEGRFARICDHISSETL